MKSSDQGNILAIKLFDPSRGRINWWYGSDYPLQWPINTVSFRHFFRGTYKWIGHARLLAEVPSTSTEYCEVYKIPSRVGFPRVPGPRILWSPGPLFLTTPVW